MWTALIVETLPTRFGSENVKGPVTLNVAVTTVGAPRDRVHGPVPEQLPPLQPPNADPPSGVAVSVTTVPPTKLAAQVAPQLMPAGMLVTVPAPAPTVETVRTKTCANVAVTVVAADTVTTHPSEPVHPPPLQPLKTQFAPGVAVSVT